jgi:enamine deaminase RidA (YjgF/YER057c/UK114 family)
VPAAGARVSVDLIAIGGGEERVGTDAPAGVPRPVVEYSPALQRGDWVFLAGFLATDFAGDVGSRLRRGEASALAPEARVNPYFWYGSDIELQTDYTLDKLERIAEAAGTSLGRCVKAEVYFGHPADLPGIERAWHRWFPGNPPARVLVPHSGLAGFGCRIEIALILLAGESTLLRETIETSAAPEPFLHEPQAMRAGDLLFLSTQLPADSRGRLAPGLDAHTELSSCGEQARLQTRTILENAAAICEAAGTRLEHLCRRQAFHDDFAWLAPSLDEWQAHFPIDPPASTTLEVGGPLPVPGAHVLLDLVGHCPGEETA